MHLVAAVFFFTTAGYQYDVLKYLKVQRSKIYNFCTTFYFILNYLLSNNFFLKEKTNKVFRSSKPIKNMLLTKAQSLH